MFFILVSINKLVLLPKSDGEHFRNLILRSLFNRYALFMKSGDTLRAQATAALLEKLGVPVPDELLPL